MFKSRGLPVVVGFLAQLLIGCGTKPVSELSAVPAGSQRVTLRVAGMTERLDITCPD